MGFVIKLLPDSQHDIPQSSLGMGLRCAVSCRILTINRLTGLVFEALESGVKV